MGKHDNRRSPKMRRKVRQKKLKARIARKKVANAKPRKVTGKKAKSSAAS